MNQGASINYVLPKDQEGTAVLLGNLYELNYKAGRGVQDFLEIALRNIWKPPIKIKNESFFNRYSYSSEG